MPSKAPAFAAATTIMDALTEAARRIAWAIRSLFDMVRAAMADPLPLRNAPIAPARSAAAMTRGKNEISLVRAG